METNANFWYNVISQFSQNVHMLNIWDPESFVYSTPCKFMPKYVTI